MTDITRWTAPLTLSLVLMAGCTTTLEGDWEGEMDCGAWGDVDLAFDLKPDQGQQYKGDGEITGLFYKGSEAELNFEINMTKFKLSGPQEVDAEIDDCELRITGFGTFDQDCENPENVEWDGEDELTGEVEDFLATGYDCDFQVDRGSR